jgi:hypothetical protein
MNFCSPLRQKKKKEEPTELPLFKPDKLTLTKSEAKKVLYLKATLSHCHILWTQRWLEQKIQERCLPPQLSGADAFAQILRFLTPHDASSLLEQIRGDFARAFPQLGEKEDEDLSFLAQLANEAYHEHQPQPPTCDHNSPKSDASP